MVKGIFFMVRTIDPDIKGKLDLQLPPPSLQG